MDAQAADGRDERPFLQHAKAQVEKNLYEKAVKALADGNYGEILKIASLQYAYNVSAISVYFDLPKGDSYDRLLRLSSIAVAAGIPDKVRAEACVAELEILTRYYKNHLAGRVFDPAAIKK